MTDELNGYEQHRPRGVCAGVLRIVRDEAERIEEEDEK